MSDSSNSKSSIAAILPILLGFFVMGFVDIVGSATADFKQEFSLSDGMAGFLPSAVFLWFFVFSVPAAILMTKIGRKNTVLLSMLITIIGMAIPFVVSTKVSILAAFALLGIGNTIIQVSLNPLLMNVVSKDKLTSWMTFGQFVKAICSAVGPILLGTVAAIWLNDWKMIFAIIGGITLLSMIWLLVTPMPMSDAEKNEKSSASFIGNLSLLSDPFILMMFLGILFVVGVDVCTNTASQSVVTQKLALIDPNFEAARAKLGGTAYFIGRMAGAFLGAIILAKFSASGVFKICMIAALASLAGMYFAPSTEIAVWATLAAIGFFCANIFSIIFSFALKHKPERADEISGLMIMGVAGGAIFPPIMGFATGKFNPVLGATIVIGICMLFLLFVSFYVGKDKKENVAA